MPKITASPALSKLRVLDLTRVRAGPSCVRQLADFGADVIKIENTQPEDMGGPREGPDFQNLHRNKRSMTLDLKSPQGKDIFLRLVKTADVVVENFRPDVKDRLGIDYESLKKVNKRVILASISGFGQDGPYRMRPGFDQIAQGLSGIMSVTGKPGEGPMRVGCAVADVTGGLLAALGILTALYERETSGEGQWVQSSLLQAGLQLLDFQAARYTMSGEVPEQVGNDHPTSMPTSAYKTADGHINVAAAGTKMWERVCKAIGRPELFEHPDYKKAESRAKNRHSLNAELNKEFAKRPSAEWVEILNEAGVPSGPIYRMDQVFNDPQVKHMQAAAEVTSKRLGKLRLVNQPVKLSRTPAKLLTASPERGEHTDEVLKEIGFSDQEIQTFRSGKII
ncbi:MAG TPA: CoA transferase [Burkholderiales bacterium]|jgi:crotonobetainyl-CoA:carnitine CoA-transferase CaiB-like acyl-CoA transferase|nr:CoA transferase [Burkholderiales bacterium]HEX2650463.1 CoA transferase [Burkholderiales bacterium]